VMLRRRGSGLRLRDQQRPQERPIKAVR
jgi:hypothetical protein